MNTYKVKYSVHITKATGLNAGTTLQYLPKRDGWLNDENLATFVTKYNASFATGGVNAHLGTSTRIIAAELINNDNGDVMATFNSKSAVSRASEKNAGVVESDLLAFHPIGKQTIIVSIEK